MSFAPSTPFFIIQLAYLELKGSAGGRQQKGERKGGKVKHQATRDLHSVVTGIANIHSELELPLSTFAQSKWECLRAEFSVHHDLGLCDADAARAHCQARKWGCE